MMIWRVEVKRDYGMGHVVETDGKYTTEAYRSIQEAIFRACREPGDYVKVSVKACNGEGMTLQMEGMKWSADGMRDFEDVCFQACEHSIREGVF